MYLLNHFSDHICELGNLLIVCFEHRENAIVNLQQGFRQLNRHKAIYQRLQTLASLKVIQYQELNAKAVKQPHNDDMPLTKAPSSEWWTTGDQKSFLLMTWPSGFKWQMEATESYCLVIQDICRLRRVCQSGSVLHSSHWCIIHSVLCGSNSSYVLSMIRASSSYGLLHLVHKVEKVSATNEWYHASLNGNESGEPF